MLSLTRFDPFNEVVNELFSAIPVRALKVDVAEKNGAYTVTAELPGVRKEDIRVDIDGAQVTLEAEVKRVRGTATEPAEGERVLYTERSYGKVARGFTLPQEVDEAKAEARFRDGVLELTLPKKAAAARKQITIQ
jgi:HSP20 family protein